jgi:hypothetical protein
MALDPKDRAQLEREGARSRKDVEEWLDDQDEKATRRWSRIKQRATVVVLLALILVLLVTIVARTLLHRSRNNRPSMIEQHVTAAGLWFAATERAVICPDGLAGGAPRTTPLWKRAGASPQASLQVQLHFLGRPSCNRSRSSINLRRSWRDRSSSGFSRSS